VIDHCEVRQCDSMAGIEGIYDLIVSNITAPVICRQLGDSAKLLSPGGLYIVSGFTHHSSVEVTQAMASIGLEIIKQYQENDWLCWVGRVCDRADSTIEPGNEWMK